MRAIRFKGPSRIKSSSSFYRRHRPVSISDVIQTIHLAIMLTRLAACGINNMILYNRCDMFLILCIMLLRHRVIRIKK